MITSTANKQVKHIIQLQKKARLRREENVFIAEGPRMVIETPKEMLEEIYVAESFEDTWDGPVDEIVSDAVMKAMSDTQTPQGVLAVVKRPSYDLEARHICFWWKEFRIREIWGPCFAPGKAQALPV